MKRIVPLFLSFVLAFAILISIANAEQMYVLCRPKDYVNVRSFASTKSEVAGRLDCGDSVETDGESKRDKQGRLWIKVYGFEGDAWICSMYLQKTPVEVGKCYGCVVSNGRTALRRSPNGKRLKWLENGTEITILAMSEEWALTTEGYVKRDYVDVYYE